MTSKFTRLRLLPLLVLFMSFFIAPQVFAAKVAGVELDDTVSIDNSTLLYNGAGIRKKLFIKLYVASLYVTDNLKGGDGQSILQADEPMLLQLDILSDLLTRDKMLKALKDGFEKATGGNTAPLQNEISAMFDSLNQPVRPGEVYKIVYTPGKGTNLTVGDQSRVTIEGLPFKQALFGIWLSDAPAQESLKKAMLGQ